ncbi:MAG TPA: cyanophycin synthetase, partial [Verrucomicrobiota bacterium]|nr:cyanophycin synthetase [Verrucomicrobiota bacterium]
VDRCDGSAAIDVLVDGTAHRIASRLHGDHMVYPMLAALAVAHAEKRDLRSAIARLQQLPPTPGRMELIVLPDGTRILDDSYKAALESVHAALETAAGIDAARKIVVLGNVEEPPGKQGEIYRDLGRRLAGFAQFVVCIGGEHMTAVRAGARAAGMDRAAVRLAGSRIGPALELLKETVRPGSLVLIKGASTQRLRRITLALLGRTCSCRVKYCAAKAASCDVCPLLQAEPKWFENHFVKRCTWL